MKDQRNKGLCYYCDSKCNLGYSCQKLKLYLIKDIKVKEVDDEQATEPMMEGDILQEELEDVNLVDKPAISLHALTGRNKRLGIVSVSKG